MVIVMSESHSNGDENRRESDQKSAFDQVYVFHRTPIMRLRLPSLGTIKSESRLGEF